MVWAKSLMDEGKIDTNSRVQWAVYGVSDPRTGKTDWIGPCGDVPGGRGCSTYVDQLARQSGGGGTCIRRRIVALKPPAVKPKPKTDGPDAVVPGGTNSPGGPDSPGAPEGLVPVGTKSPDGPDAPDAPERLVPGEKTPDDLASPNGDKDKTFEEGAICKLPARNTGAAKNAAELPDPSGLANLAPPPDNNNPKLKIRGTGWN
jgi:hypothetical protein